MRQRHAHLFYSVIHIPDRMEFGRNCNCSLPPQDTCVKGSVLKTVIFYNNLSLDTVDDIHIRAFIGVAHELAWCGMHAALRLLKLGNTNILEYSTTSSFVPVDCIMQRSHILMRVCCSYYAMTNIHIHYGPERSFCQNYYRIKGGVYTFSVSCFPSSMISSLKFQWHLRN